MKLIQWTLFAGLGITVLNFSCDIFADTIPCVLSKGANAHVLYFAILPFALITIYTFSIYAFIKKDKKISVASACLWFLCGVSTFQGYAELSNKNINLLEKMLIIFLPVIFIGSSMMLILNTRKRI